MLISPADRHCRPKRSLTKNTEHWRASLCIPFSFIVNFSWLILYRHCVSCCNFSFVLHCVRCRCSEALFLFLSLSLFLGVTVVNKGFRTKCCHLLNFFITECWRDHSRNFLFCSSVIEASQKHLLWFWLQTRTLQSNLNYTKSASLQMLTTYKRNLLCSSLQNQSYSVFIVVP